MMDTPPADAQEQHERDEEAARLAELASQLPVVVTDPDTLIAQGRMPQIPYAKLERVPEGFEAVARFAVNLWDDGGDESVPRITERHLTMELGRTWPDQPNPDLPQTVARRLALLGAALTEGGEVERWCVAAEIVGERRSCTAWVDDRDVAVLRFAEWGEVGGRA